MNMPAQPLALGLALLLWIAGALSAAELDPTDRSLADSTRALQQRIDRDGHLILEAGRYRLTAPLVLDLAKGGAGSVRAQGPVTLIMNGPGPALRILGSHEGTAGPTTFRAETWRERMPHVDGIEILGAHPGADGIALDGTMQPIITSVAIRNCRHGIHLVNRNRNVVISAVQIYECSGVGIYLDQVNLHQINIGTSHISYNRQGGIVIRDGNVRNVHIVGCDIEANMPGDLTTTDTANILIDVSGTPGDRKHSIAEVTIAGCTIQHSANYSGVEGRLKAEGGANIRLLGKPAYLIDTVAITGNVLSDTTDNVVISHAMDVAIAGNAFFAPGRDHLLVSNSERVVVSGNTFNPRQFDRPAQIRFRNCRDCLLANSTQHDAEHPDGAIVLEKCEGVTLSGLVVTDCHRGIVLKDTTETLITACSVRRTRDNRPALELVGENLGLERHANRFQGGVEGDPAD